MTIFVNVRKGIDNNFIISFGSNLRKIRESKKMSMQTLAYTTNIEYSQISRIERGLINTSIGIAHQIAIALEVNIIDLFIFDNNKK